MNQSDEQICVAFVITELEVGGAERCLANLASRLDRTRFTSTVFVLAPPPKRDDLVAQLDQAQVPVRFLGFSRPWQMPAAVRKLRAALRQSSPHIVQSMLFHANVVTRLAFSGGRQARWCAGVRVADPSRVRQAIEGRALRAASCVVCVSRRVADFATRKMRVPCDTLAVIPNGVDTQGARAQRPANLQQFGLPPDQRAITCVARLDEQKGIDQLLAAAPHILHTLPQHDLLLVGDGPQTSELRQLADQTGLSDRIHFCGFQSDVRAILQASDLMVLPSRWEGMPNVLLEAMACGRPVVCTAAEGVLEVLGALGKPQTVPIGDPQLLSEKVVKVIASPELASRLGAANRQQVTRHFSMQAMLRQYENLYTQLSQG